MGHFVFLFSIVKFVKYFIPSFQLDSFWYKDDIPNFIYKFCSYLPIFRWKLATPWHFDLVFLFFSSTTYQASRCLLSCNFWPDWPTLKSEKKRNCHTIICFFFQGWSIGGDLQKTCKRINFYFSSTNKMTVQCIAVQCAIFIIWKNTP